ncbi:hypothetical protein VNO77_27850 [Canavalia gladiata]|uniref:Uncharacterized protein n=1 Tax=Canavalia gladiata TaxID=3824 RepID=A0AAN9Q6V9_CANGL
MRLEFLQNLEFYSGVSFCSTPLIFTKAMSVSQMDGNRLIHVRVPSLMLCNNILGLTLVPWPELNGTIAFCPLNTHKEETQPFELILGPVWNTIGLVLLVFSLKVQLEQILGVISS